MLRTYIIPVVAGAFLVAMAAPTVSGEYANAQAASSGGTPVYYSKNRARVVTRKQVRPKYGLTPGQLFTQGLVVGGWLPSMFDPRPNTY